MITFEPIPKNLTHTFNTYSGGFIFVLPLVHVNHNYVSVHLLLQIDLLDQPGIRNVIILQTVLQEVRHNSLAIYKRLRDIIDESEKNFYVFTNEHHR